MTPAIMGNLTALAQKIQTANSNAIAAQKIATNAATVAASALSSVTSTTTALSLSFITPIAQASGASSATWTTTTVSGIPAGTSAIKCEFVVNLSGAASGQIRVRQTGTTNDFAVVGLATANNVGGYAAACADVPLNASLQFDYEVTGADSWTIRVIGYW